VDRGRSVEGGGKQSVKGVCVAECYLKWSGWLAIRSLYMGE
jgi:hypothetical protein